jgi:hypothetical protein
MNQELADDAKKIIKILAVGRKKGNKQPVATMVPLKNVDMESLALSYHPDFMEIIEKARAEVEPGKRFWKGNFFAWTCNKRWGNSRPKVLEHLVDTLLYFAGTTLFQELRC